ncbi:MAG: ATP synthase F1 subunit gamma [Anaerolineaceae bacterium]|nr:ATP synthase F1 subunit gamma [Anaerolineaceae bacterium]
MQSTKNLQRRINSIENLTQMTKAIETVSAVKFRHAVKSLQASRPYAEKAWKVLMHLARQPGHESLHPLLLERETIKNALVILVSADTGLVGAFNNQIVQYTLDYFKHHSYTIQFIALGLKGKIVLNKYHQEIIADYSFLPDPPSFSDILPISRMVIDRYSKEEADRIFIAYTRYVNKFSQVPIIRKLLPLETAKADDPADLFNVTHPTHQVFNFEPEGQEILDFIIQRFTAIQIQEAILESLASEHSSRMMTMHNASENGKELYKKYELNYHRIRQKGITDDLLDIINGSSAVSNLTENE